MRHGTEQVRESIQDHKIPLLDICRQALEDHYQFMRLSHKDSIVAAGRARLEELIGRKGSDMSNSELCQHVEKLLSLHHFAVWHDHSTVCGCGYILVTLKEAYNSTVQLSLQEVRLHNYPWKRFVRSWLHGILILRERAKRLGNT